MTEGERAFYKRRIREEMQMAGTVTCPDAKARHLHWARFFNDRLEGRKVMPPEPLPSQYA